MKTIHYRAVEGNEYEYEYECECEEECEGEGEGEVEVEDEVLDEDKDMRQITLNATTSDCVSNSKGRAALVNVEMSTMT